MRFLIIGGLGFLGRNLIEQIVKSKQQIRIFDRNTLKSDDKILLGANVEYICGDFSNAEELKSAIIGVDIIFHLVSTTLPKTSNEDMVNDVQSNVVATLRLLEIARKEGVKKIIYFSSGGTVYGLSKIVPSTEDSITRPLCSYGIHKVTIESYLHLYYTLYGLDYAVMRISNPYGPYQKNNSVQGIIPVIVDKIINEDIIDIWGDGTIIRDYIYVDDVIEAALKLTKYSGIHKVFNIGSGVGYSLNELINKISQVLNKNPQVNYMSPRSIDVPVNILDISRARIELNWNPSISLDEGILRFNNHLKK